jgi:hypothetical protein
MTKQELIDKLTTIAIEYGHAYDTNINPESQRDMGQGIWEALDFVKQLDEPSSNGCNVCCAEGGVFYSEQIGDKYAIAITLYPNRRKLRTVVTCFADGKINLEQKETAIDRCPNCGRKLT